MRYRFIIVFLIFISFTGYGQEKWSLQKCVDYAVSHNLTVQSAKYQFQLSKLTEAQSKKTLIPTLGGSVSAGYQHGLNENPATGTLQSANFISGGIGAQSNYTIFNWGARKNNIEANKLYAKADEVGIDRAKNDISLFVANAFLQVMLRREQVRISELQLQQSQAQLENTRKLVDAGSQPELNAIQIEAQVARDSSALLQSQALVQQGIINLKSYLNLDQSAPFDIESPAIEAIPIDNISELQPEAVYAFAEKNQPLQRMLAIRMEGAKKQVAAARGAMYPPLTAFGGLNSRLVNAKSPVLIEMPAQPTPAYVTVNGNKVPVFSPQRGIAGYKGIPFFDQLNRNFGQNIGLSINVPIFNQGISRTQWERTKVNVLQTQLQDEQERVNLKTNIYNAYQDAFSALQKYNATIRNVEVSQKALDFSKKRLDIGLLGTLDYIVTQNNLFRARIEEVSNRYDYVFKMKVLEFYKGQGLRL
ncbi:MAG: TolC family protein [Segetibacter sp.]|nr:TolC family protein [Segetibacter sp.]